MKKKMFHYAPPEIFANAKVLRNQLTHAEVILWGYLKQKPFGFRFRRQHPLNDYIADFFSYKLNLVIEVDGGIHELPEVKEKDIAKEKWLAENGYSVLRFTNFQIEKEFEKVIPEIENRIKLIISAVSWPAFKLF